MRLYLDLKPTIFEAPTKQAVLTSFKMRNPSISINDPIVVYNLAKHNAKFKQKKNKKTGVTYSFKKTANTKWVLHGYIINRELAKLLGLRFVQHERNFEIINMGK